MVALMYPLDPVAAVRFTRNHGAVQRGLLQFVGRKFEYEAQNAFELKYHYYPAETVERIRNQVSLSALKSLIVHMGGLKEGRKALVLVSEGYSNMLPPQLRNPIATFPGFGNPNRSEANAGVGDLNEFRAQALSSFDMQQELRQTLHNGESLQRGDLCRRSSWAGFERLQHRGQHRRRDGSRLPEFDDEHAAGACRRRLMAGPS